MFGSDSASQCQTSAAAAKSKQRRPASRALRFESLERREVLSGFQATFDLAIKGTSVEFSELGLPAAMTGDVFAAKDSVAGKMRIGQYQETLTPILMDINGDAVPDFVGTTGVSTFSFFVGSPARGSIGSVTTTNISYIQGFTPEGQILVGSQGTIVDGTKMLKHVSGEFVSQSTVVLGPAFEMQTFAHFTVEAMKPAFAALTGCDVVHTKKSADPPAKHGNDKSSSACQGAADHTSGHVDNLPGPASHGSNGCLDSRGVDKNLKSNVDWTLDAVTENAMNSMAL